MDFGVCDKSALIVLGATFFQDLSLSLSFSLSLCYSQVWARLGQDGAPSPSQADQWYTCEHWPLQSACRSLCIPSYSRCYLSIGKCSGSSRARPLHRRGGELRLRNFGSPRNESVSWKTKTQRSVARWEAMDVHTHFETLKKEKGGSRGLICPVSHSSS